MTFKELLDKLFPDTHRNMGLYPIKKAKPYNPPTPPIMDEEYIQSDNISTDTKTVIYKKKVLQTRAEIIFYRKLIKLEDMGDFIVLPQINLATVIRKIPSKTFQNELFRNIDYGIFDRNFNVLLLIELNDESHNQKNRIARDINVKKLCNEAGIKLLTFYTKYPNGERYIIKRTLDAIHSDEDIELLT